MRRLLVVGATVVGAMVGAQTAEASYPPGQYPPGQYSITALDAVGCTVHYPPGETRPADLPRFDTVTRAFVFEGPIGTPYKIETGFFLDEKVVRAEGTLTESPQTVTIEIKKDDSQGSNFLTAFLADISESAQTCPLPYAGGDTGDTGDSGSGGGDAGNGRLPRVGGGPRIAGFGLMLLGGGTLLLSVVRRRNPSSV